VILLVIDSVGYALHTFDSTRYAVRYPTIKSATYLGQYQKLCKTGTKYPERIFGMINIMQTYVEIFSQGEEVISGQTVDSNAAWLSQELVHLGFTVKRHTAVGDDLLDLKALLKEISQRTDCCICTGGLGPTVDDLTAQAVAEVFDLPLVLDPVALKQIQAYFISRNREMVDANRKQAFFPQGAERIDNEWGTAPGFTLFKNNCWFVFLPGVPYEMKAMFTEKVITQLKQRFSLQAKQLITIRSTGIGESDLQEKINLVDLPDYVQLGFRASADEVQTKLLFSEGVSQEQVDIVTDQVSTCIGDFVFTVDDEIQNQHRNLVSVIAQKMHQLGLSLSVQETASQGLISAKCMAQSWLVSSCFNASLQQSECEDYFEIAEEIATKIQQQHGTDLALVQLYQGSAEQFRNKQQSINVYNLLLTPKGIKSSEFKISGEQQRKQNQAALLALDLLRRYLQNL